MLLSFSFDQGRAWFKNKFVRTKGFVDEQVRRCSNGCNALQCGQTNAGAHQLF